MIKRFGATLLTLILVASGVGQPVDTLPSFSLHTLEGGTVIYKQTAEEFVADMQAIAGLGADVVGGCCGTDPSFIALLRAGLADRLGGERPSDRGADGAQVRV